MAMTKRKIPPARQRYEAAHPTLTVRIPAEVRTTLQQAAEAEGLSVSEWLQAQVAGHVSDVAQAYQSGIDHGRRAGMYAGLLMALWAQQNGQHHDPVRIVRYLADHPDLLTVAREGWIHREQGSQMDAWIRRLLRSAMQD